MNLLIAILGLIFGYLLWLSAYNEDQMRAARRGRSYRVYDDEDTLMEDLEDWILVEDLEEEDEEYSDEE